MHVILDEIKVLLINETFNRMIAISMVLIQNIR